MTLSWFQIFRLGFVQMALGAIVVLTTSTLNRLMVVELSLPALLPGLLGGSALRYPADAPALGFLFRHRWSSDTLDHWRHGRARTGRIHSGLWRACF